MEQTFHTELENELTTIDIDSIKLDAVIQLRTWQKKMYSLIDKTYKNRLHEIDSIGVNIADEIKEKQNEIKHKQIHDENIYNQIKKDIDSLKSCIHINESIPENLDHRIERTIRVTRIEFDPDTEIVDDEDEDENEDEDEPVLIDINRHKGRAGQQVVLVVAPTEQTPKNNDGTVAKVFKSEPVQHALAVGLANAVNHIGTTAVVTTTTVAATSMAQTALIATVCGVGTVAYGVGRIAFGATRKLWSLMVSSDE